MFNTTSHYVRRRAEDSWLKRLLYFFTSIKMITDTCEQPSAEGVVLQPLLILHFTEKGKSKEA